MLARSAVFDIYGDHLLARGGWAPISTLIQLNSTLDIAAAATRTAVSRMVREGWLTAQEQDGLRGYAATPRARHRLGSAGHRIYAEPLTWDETWHVVVVEHSADRSVRARTKASMRYLGYAPLAVDTWVAARRSDDLIETLGPGFREFGARFGGDPRSLAADLWDLPALAVEHQRFLAWLTDLTNDAAAVVSDRDAYAVRARVVHEWRKFLFTDPGLPQAALPQDWPGRASADRFRAVAADLRPGAAAYVDSSIRTAGKESP
ncbi:PaaX family transcriptional regulator [Calidifontibacter terrae]